MKQAQITKLIFVPTGHYHDMALRPYTAQASGTALERLSISTNGFSNLSTGALAGVAGSILRPQTVSAGTLSIANGWNESRYMFMMEVVHDVDNYDAESSGQRVQYISGYTDYCGDPSYRGSIDPEMRLYLNTVINTREIGRGGHVHRQPVSADRFLQNNLASPNNYHAMRPRDVCQTVGNAGLGDYTVDVDYRTSTSATPLMSSVRNDLPTDYMSRMFSAYRLSVNDVRNTAMDLPQLMDAVAENTGDNPVIDDPFILNLYRNTELSEGSCFTYGELCQLFRGTDQVAYVAPPATMSRDIGFEQHQPQDTSHWTGSGSSTIAATILGSTVPALMADAMLTQVAFFITNDTINGQPIMEWLSPADSFMLVGQSKASQMQYFEGRMIHEIFRDLTRNGNMIMSVRVFSDLVTSDTRIEIDVDGEGMVPYCVPNFASSLISPVIANNRSQLDAMATAVTDIFEYMAPSTVHNHTANEPAFTLNHSDLATALRTRGKSPTTGGWTI